MTTTLYGWGRMFDLPSPSPYVTKSDIQLQMLGVGFDRAIADLDSVSKQKAPYVLDDGTLIEDSAFIRKHFEAKTGTDLDAGLSLAERATAHALGGMLEARLAQIIVCERWLIDANFERGPIMFFADVPEQMRGEVIAQVRGDLRGTMHGAGFARYTRAELMLIAAADIAAASALLGDKTYLFGDTPSATDATAFGILAGAATRFFDSELPDLVATHSNLMAYLERMEVAYFPVDRWPAMG